MICGNAYFSGFPGCERLRTEWHYVETLNAGGFLGRALHTLEDLYCPSHVWRSDDGGETSSPDAAIYRFQSYEAQDRDKHMMGDNPNVNPQYYVAAVSACTELLTMFKNRVPVDADPNEPSVRKWLLNGPLKLADGILIL